MSRSSDHPTDAIQQTAPRSAPAANAPDGPPAQRIPFKWRLVFGFWAVSFIILVLYELMVNFARIVFPAAK